MSVVDGKGAAFECYMMVGDRALASFDFQVAANNYNLALQSANANVDNNITEAQQCVLPKTVVPSINLAKCLRELARYQEAEGVLTKCIKDARDPTVDKRLHARVLTTLAELYQAQSKYESALELHQQAVRLA